MRIARLRLQDVRRFDTLDLALEPGINLLRGANGAGKTTLLEAIGFALFGAPLDRGGPELSALRDGASSLKVEVEVAHEGASWRVSRSLGRHLREMESATLSAVDTGDVLATGEAAVHGELAARLGLAGADELRRLFRHRVGIPQGDAGHALLLAPDERRAHFRELLDLERYGRAAGRARALAAPFADDLDRLDLEAARGEGALAGYREAQERREACAGEARSAEERCREALATLASLDDQAKEIEQHRVSLEAVVRERAVLAETARGRAQEEARVRALLEEAEAAAGMVAKAEAAHARWESLEAECRGLELQRAGHPVLRAEVAELERRRAEERAAIDGARADLASRLDDNQRQSEAILLERDGIRAQLETLRGLARRLEGAGNGLVLARGRGERLQSLLAGVVPATEDVEPDREAERREAMARHAEQAAAAAAREARTTELAALHARAATEDDAQALLREAQEAADRLHELLGEVKRHLEQVRPAAGACPLLKEPCGNVAGRSLIEHFAGEVAKLEASGGAAVEAVRLAQSRLDDARSARALHDRKLRETPAGETPHPGPRPGARRKERTAPAPPPATTVAFDEISHHLSALAGVLGATEPEAAAAQPAAPRALIGAVAGKGDASPRPAAPSLELPDSEEIEAARRLAHEAEAARRMPPGADRDQHLGNLARRLAGAVRRIHAATVTAEARVRTLLVENRSTARAGEHRLLDTSKSLEMLSLERARIRAASKELASQDLRVLDIELALTERRMRLGALDRLEREVAGKRAEQAQLLTDHDTYRAHTLLADRVETYREEWKQLDKERLSIEARLGRLDAELAAAGKDDDRLALEQVAAERDRLHAEVGMLSESVRALAREGAQLDKRLEELEAGRARLLAIEASRGRARRGLAVVDALAAAYQAMTEPVAAALAAQVEQEANRLYRGLARRPRRIRWQEDFGIVLGEGGLERRFAELSRGEQAGVALALAVALSWLPPRAGLLLLDEPTAHLDEQRRRALGLALQAYRRSAAGYLEQIIVASHDDGLETAADHVIRLEPVDRGGGRPPDPRVL